MWEESAEIKAYVPEVLADHTRSVTVLMPQPDMPSDEPYVDEQNLVPKVMPAFLCGLAVCLNGPPGCGKTSLAHVLARQFWNAPLYTCQGHGEQEPGDLGCRPRLSVDPEGRLVASPLIAAMIHGGLFFFDEIAKSPERALALLASVLDQRRSIDSDVAGVKIKAHPRFRVIATINPEDRELSRFIRSRLAVNIKVAMPTAAQLCKMVAAHFEFESFQTLLEAFKLWADGKENITPRDAIHIIRFADSQRQVEGRPTLSPRDAARLIAESASLIVESV